MPGPNRDASLYDILMFRLFFNLYLLIFLINKYINISVLLYKYLDVKYNVSHKGPVGMEKRPVAIFVVVSIEIRYPIKRIFA